MHRKRRSFPLEYAHVAVYLGHDEVVHVSREGLKSVIKKENVEKVVGRSPCFVKSISEPPPNLKRSISECAQACVGLKFQYSVTDANCETFVNGITEGRFYTTQGEEHKMMAKVIGIINWMNVDSSE